MRSTSTLPNVRLDDLVRTFTGRQRALPFSHGVGVSVTIEEVGYDQAAANSRLAARLRQIARVLDGEA